MKSRSPTGVRDGAPVASGTTITRSLLVNATSLPAGETYGTVNGPICASAGVAIARQPVAVIAHSAAFAALLIVPQAGSRADTTATATRLRGAVASWSTAPGRSQSFAGAAPQRAIHTVSLRLLGVVTSQPSPRQAGLCRPAASTFAPRWNNGSVVSRFGSLARVRGGAGPSRSASANSSASAPA